MSTLDAAPASPQPTTDPADHEAVLGLVPESAKTHDVRGQFWIWAGANIAPIKYWGKADEALIIPRTSSLSLTLDELYTTTTVEFGGEGAEGAGGTYHATLDSSEERPVGVVCCTRWSPDT